MPVACPACGVDGTETANQLLAGHFPDQTPPIPVAALARPPIAPRLNVALPAGVAPARTAPRPIAPMTRPLPSRAGTGSKEFSMGLGVLGAFLGAVVGAILVYAFFEWVGFRFPWSGVGIGALTGYGARLMGRGTHTTLGVIAGAIALAAIVGVFFLMYGGFFLFGIISIVLCVGVAYRLASE